VRVSQRKLKGSPMERLPGRKQSSQAGSLDTIPLIKGEGKKRSLQRVSARGVPKKGAAGKDPDGKNAHRLCPAVGDDIAVIGFSKTCWHEVPRARIQKVVRHLHRFKSPRGDHLTKRGRLADTRKTDMLDTSLGLELPERLQDAALSQDIRRGNGSWLFPP